MREDRRGCVRPLTDIDSLGGAPAIVFKSRVVYATRLPGSGDQVEWDGPTVVLKGCFTMREPITEGRRRMSILHMMLHAEHEVLTSLPPHPNIVELVHHFESHALLLRPFFHESGLPLFDSRCAVYAVQRCVCKLGLCNHFLMSCALLHPVPSGTWCFPSTSGTLVHTSHQSGGLRRRICRRSARFFCCLCSCALGLCTCSGTTSVTATSR